MFVRVLLYSTSLSRPVKHLQLRVDDLLDQLVRFRGEHRALWVLLQHLDAWLVHEEGVVEDVELVVEDAERVALRHFVALSFPAQPLVVVGVHVGSNVDWLKILLNLSSF